MIVTQRMRDIKQVRAGQMGMVFPELFPEDGPFTRPIVANMVDVAARDLSEVIAPLPSFNCSSSSMVSDRARQFAEKRTRIATYYVQYSQLQKQAYTAADRYVTFGFVPGIVEIDWDEKMARLKWLDSMGTYTVRDRRDRVKALFQTINYHVDDLVAKFPQLENVILAQVPVLPPRLRWSGITTRMWTCCSCPVRAGLSCCVPRTRWASASR
jgi:hypothetical protein